MNNEKNEKIDLAREQCIPCQGGVPPMSIIEAQKMLPSLNEGWSVNSAGHLERVFLVRNFVEALNLANSLGKVAEDNGHHPDLLVSYGKLRAEIWTHKIGGLSRADFVLAAKFDEVVGKK
ncbi:MAG TPA: 4a-hydroxytetrahydrobiopterin dehydratase [Myxococcota bacterium]|nr:4a-hydroxytetrahydrobiopterin dehydratase [Myxococcota bacterium]